MPFPWFLSLLLCSMVLWAVVCTLSSFHLLDSTPDSMGSDLKSSRMEMGWLDKKL